MGQGAVGACRANGRETQARRTFFPDGYFQSPGGFRFSHPGFKPGGNFIKGVFGDGQCLPGGLDLIFSLDNPQVFNNILNRHEICRQPCRFNCFSHFVVLEVGEADTFKAQSPGVEAFQYFGEFFCQALFIADDVIKLGLLTCLGVKAGIRCQDELFPGNEKNSRGLIKLAVFAGVPAEVKAVFSHKNHQCVDICFSQRPPDVFYPVFQYVFQRLLLWI